MKASINNILFEYMHAWYCLGFKMGDVLWLDVIIMKLGDMCIVLRSYTWNLFIWSKINWRRKNYKF